MSKLYRTVYQDADKRAKAAAKKRNQRAAKREREALGFPPLTPYEIMTLPNAMDLFPELVKRYRAEGLIPPDPDAPRHSAFDAKEGPTSDPEETD